MTHPTPSQGFSTPQGVRRRALIKSAAWSVPVIAAAVAVPAQAASECRPTTNFDQLVPGTSPSRITFEPSGVTASLAFRSSGQASSRPGATGKVSRTTTQPAWNYIEMQLVQPLSTGNYIELTISLSEAVTGLSILLHDIDKNRATSWAATNWVDTVVVMTPGFQYERGSNIVGTGTTSSPFAPQAWGDTPISGGAGRLRLTWPGEVKTVTIRYLAGAAGNAQSQHIGLGDLSYEACLVPQSSSVGIQARGAQAQAEIISVEDDDVVPEESDVDVAFDA